MQIRNARNVLAAGVMLGCLAGAQAIARGQTVSGWTVGDTWKVGTWHGLLYKRGSGAPASQEAYNPRGRMITVTFQVSDIKTVGDRQCYEVQVTYPREDTGFQRRYQAYYCKTTGRLLRVRDVSLRPGGTIKDITTDYPADAQGPTLVEGVPSLVPLDWPDPARQNVTPQAGQTNAPSQATTIANVQSTSGAAQRENHVALTERSGSNQVQVTQYWRPGEHWWREAKKYENGQLVTEAVLLEINGTKIADAPDQAQ